MRHMSHDCDMTPSPTELILLKRLWSHGTLSARELHTAAEAELDWSYSSTRKTLERMQHKGLVRASQSHGLKVYQASAGKLPTIAAMVRRFATDVLGLTGPLPVSNLVDSTLLDDDELTRLEQMLAESDQAADEDGTR